MSAECPRPEKVAFPNHHAAAQHAAWHQHKTPDLRAYECVCGAWHVGKYRPLVSFDNRMKAALVSGTATTTESRRRDQVRARR